jgi:hypothetical protein
METATETALETAPQTVLMETKMDQATRMEMARMGINPATRTDLDLTETKTEAAKNN